MEAAEADGEQGEEEAMTEDEEVDGMDGASTARFSKAQFSQLAPLQVSLGSIAESEVAKKRPAAKRRKTEAVEPEEDAEAARIGGEVDPEVDKDPLLHMMVENLGYCPPCFAGLVPSKVLVQKTLVGKQLRGAGRCWRALTVLS